MDSYALSFFYRVSGVYNCVCGSCIMCQDIVCVGVCIICQDLGVQECVCVGVYICVQECVRIVCAGMCQDIVWLGSYNVYISVANSMTRLGYLLNAQARY